MSAYSIVENPSAEVWKSFLDMFPEGNFEQCFHYGEICKTAFPKTRVARLAITCNGEPIGIIQGTYSTYLGFGMSLEVMRGPVVKAENDQGFQGLRVSGRDRHSEGGILKMRAREKPLFYGGKLNASPPVFIYRERKTSEL